ncbi:aminotransferase class V-fold PLP-dependent enzyme [Methylacidiphilum caldifontis]|uniref:Cysteine desulfurase n=1 Tax=Methylacidiphilum caldifontis TaxID=2795386 RepID=A0A4Y8PFK1_9BACT|nr:SufS family cysteine desulfurase [Methylacidiphilum caldifontis]QSR88253.1 SufS family cysteine desulfurase [Methylacidiphilum caldifontis]TFE70726.1 cysteine desulfurase [Methylacidiphilum caldifontis]
MEPIETFRKDFPILSQRVNGYPLVYFDNAATTQKPRQVIDALSNFFLSSNANVHRGLHELSNRATELLEESRQKIAHFIHAQGPEEIVFTKGTTESLNLVASSLGSLLKPAEGILLTEMEHHSNLIPWQQLAKQRGLRLFYLPIKDKEGGLQMEKLEEIFTHNRIAVFSFTHVSNTLGVINPVESLCSIARKHGVISVVDAAQSAGHRLIDVQKIGCDFLAFSGHKMCGPTGIGVLYGKKEWLEKIPPYQFGGNMVLEADFSDSRWKDPPHKFEAGTLPIAEAIGLKAAIDYLCQIGLDKIALHDEQIGSYAYSKISSLPCIIPLGPKGRRAGIVSFSIKGLHPHDFISFCDRYGIALRGGHHCNKPLLSKLGIDSTVRASFYFYNTQNEVDQFMEIAEKCLRFFKLPCN